MTDSTEQVRDTLDELAAAVVLANPADPAQLAQLLRYLQPLAAWAAVHAGPEIVKDLEQAVELVRAVMMGTAPDAFAALSRVGNSVTVLQDLVREPSRPASLAPAPSTAVLGESSGDWDMLRDFVIEAREHLQHIEQRLLALEHAPQASDLKDVFRSFHSLKGMAGFLRLTDIATLSHEMESLLDAARRDPSVWDEEASHLALAAYDAAKELVEEAADRLSGGGSKNPQPRFGLAALVVRIQDHARELASTIAPTPGAVEEAAMAPQDEVPPACESGKHTTRRMRRFREPIKVDAERLDRLVDTIGELVTVASMIRLDVDGLDGQASALSRRLGQLEKITRELHATGTLLRMVPIQPVFQRMTRLARDLAERMRKRVEIVATGGETELDKTIVEGVCDPLLHIVRNALDHGLETPAERERAGKPAIARLELRAFHKGGAIHIEVADDGRGLDIPRILASARKRGMLDEQAAPDSRAISELLFQPGFSTAEKVSDLSGRGVGLDVVRRWIEGLRGAVEIAGEPGQGTTVRLRLPLTLAIIDGMLAQVGAERYVVPTLSIVTSLRPRSADLVSVAGCGQLLKVHGQFVPVIPLGRLFEYETDYPDPTTSIAVIVESEGRSAALLVDALLGQRQFVIKPLGRAMCRTPGISGGAIMPDGSVGLILDVGELIRADTKAGHFQGREAVTPSDEREEPTMKLECTHARS